MDDKKNTDLLVKRLSMFDFPMTKSSIWTALYITVVYILILANYRKDVFHPFVTTVGRRKRNTAVFLIGFFIITHCLRGDFFHLMEAIYEFNFIPGEGVYSVEMFYYYLAMIVDKNYFLFRVTVWGGAYAIFCYIVKRMELPVYYMAIIIFATHVITFSYARATLAMATYFLGATFLCHPIKRKSIGYIIGFILILLSPQFHTSAWIMVLLTFMLFVPVNKWTILLSIACLFLITNIVKDYMGMVMLSSSTDEYMARRLSSYSERETERGIASIILAIFEYSSFYIPFICSSICIIRSRKKRLISKDVFLYYKIAAGLLLASSIFYIMGSSYVTFYYRILFMTMIPSTIIVGRLYKDGILSHRQLTYCMLPGILWHVMRYAYDIYLTDLDIPD